MFSIFKKLFGKSVPPTAQPAAAATRPLAHSEAGAPLPSVEVAHLSLAAIVSRFPDELKPNVLTAPDATATIALPLALIHRQLATGAVKMSYASLHRQAPPGVFAPITAGDKRQVEIPLKEVFRHLNPSAFRRRQDQRPLDVVDNDFNLFGSSDNPYAIAPTTPENPPRKDSTALHFKPPTPSRVGFQDPPAPHGRPSGITPPSAMRMVAPPSGLHRPESAAGAPPAPRVKSDEPPLTLPLAPLASGWPAEICGEITALDPATTVTLDAGGITAGLAKGKVLFTWGEIRAGLQPAPAEATLADENITLQLPLKIIAPAYLAATKKERSARKGVAVDDSIPALFNDGRGPAPVEAEPLAAPVEEPAEKAVPEPIHEPLALTLEPVAARIPETVGEIFGDPGKTEFTPAEIVAVTVKLPGVSGAIVALQEGLPVAHVLPDGVKSEVIAAFLPQIFARLNQYSGEMKLGEVDDLLFTTHGAHCQIYRLGFVYFAVLGKPAESLPWHELRLISAELARQTNK